MSSRAEPLHEFTAGLLARNLKAFNAKERDHLMRFAYLGQTVPYEKTDRWLSEEMEGTLRKKTGLPDGARCVFAGMDYHLDWLYAALLLSCRGADVQDALEKGRDPLKGLKPQRCDGRQAPVSTPPVGHPRKGHQSDDPTLHPVSGLQEDLDMLVLFEDDSHRAHLLFIEAKGVAAFGSVQLNRKLTRLDSILEAAGALERAAKLSWHIVLVSPKEPNKEKLQDSCAIQQRMCTNGRPLIFVKLEGLLPGTPLAKVTRIPTDKYTHWEVVPRWKVAKR